jgi:hypothetical protein
MPTVSIAKGRGYLNHNDRSIDRVSEKSWDPELSRKNVICRNIPIEEINKLKSCDMHILSCDKVKNGKFVLGYDIHYTFVDEDGFYK